MWAESKDLLKIPKYKSFGKFFQIHDFDGIFISCLLDSS